MRPSSTRTPHAPARRAYAFLIAAALLLALPSAVSADAPPGPYFNGFETNTAGWFNYSGATITRVASGSSSTYANGVLASTGNYYARLGIDPSPDSCTRTLGSIGTQRLAIRQAGSGVTLSSTSAPTRSALSLAAATTQHAAVPTQPILDMRRSTS